MEGGGGRVSKRDAGDVMLLAALDLHSIYVLLCFHF